MEQYLDIMDSASADSQRSLFEVAADAAARVSEDSRHVIVRRHRMNYARLQQYRRLSRAVGAAAAGGIAAVVAVGFASAGAPSLAGFVLLVALGLGLYSRHWLSLARRSAVGARSEDAVSARLRR